MEEIFLELKDKIYEQLDINVDLTDEILYEIIDENIFEISRGKILSITQKEELRIRLFNAIKRLDILQELLEDDTVTEVMINGYKDIFLERQGKIERWNKSFESKTKLEDIAQRLAAMSNKTVNESNPVVEIGLKSKERISIVLPPISLNEGPIITIRKFYEKPITIDELIGLGSITKEAADFLEMLVKCRYNIIISGGTGSGKTTFLNALSNFIPKDERIITIEDSAELQLNQVANLVRLEARTANSEGNNEVTIRDLIKASLRMRPDRIVVGEVRGPEAIDMIQAMMTGHDGSLSTGHSNNSRDMLTRLETMVLMGMNIPIEAIRQQIASAIDIVVHLSRMRDKSRKVVEISEVGGYDGKKIVITPLYKFKEEGEDEKGRIKGRLYKTNYELDNSTKLLESGFKKR